MNRPGFHATVLTLYIVLTPVSYLMGWLNSVTFVSLLSVWALVESRFSSFVIARGLKEQNEANPDMP